MTSFSVLYIRSYLDAPRGDISTTTYEGNKGLKQKRQDIGVGGDLPPPVPTGQYWTNRLQQRLLDELAIGPNRSLPALTGT